MDVFINAGNFKSTNSLIGSGKTIYDDFKEATKRNIFRKLWSGIKSIKNRIGNVFGKRKRKELIQNQNKTTDGESIETTSGLTIGSLIVPVEGFNPKHVVTMLPVYVMNGALQKTGPGLAGNYDLIGAYAGKKGKGNRVELTRDAATIIADFKAKFGVDPTSKFLFKNPQLHKTYTVSSADLKLINEYNAWNPTSPFTFSNGGVTYSDSYITGDARGKNIFAGGAKPELVRTYSRSPVVSTITPLKKFATGGTSTSSPLDIPTGLTGSLPAKIQLELDRIAKKSQIAQLIQSLGGEVSPDFLTMKEKSLMRSLKAAIKKFKKNKKRGTAVNSKVSSDSKAMGISQIEAGEAKPVYVVNKFAAGNSLINSILDISDTVRDQFAQFELAMGSGF